jgi:hypothetical protein
VGGAATSDHLQPAPSDAANKKAAGVAAAFIF